jgi:hypothetical protein
MKRQTVYFKNDERPYEESNILTSPINAPVASWTPVMYAIQQNCLQKNEKDIGEKKRKTSKQSALNSSQEKDKFQDNAGPPDAKDQHARRNLLLSDKNRSM